MKNNIKMDLVHNSSTPTTNNEEEHHICQLILYDELFDNAKIRIWDVIILIPNLLFLLYLVFHFNRARLKLRATSSPIFFTFYFLVFLNVSMSVFRCIISMSLTYNGPISTYVYTILWVTVKFFLLSTEMSVVIFGLAFGHLDSRSSIRHVLLATSLISLAFSITQAILEIIDLDQSFDKYFHDKSVFGHGGMFFWLASSLLFTLIYLFILFLPWTSFKDRLALPTKKSFYVYIFLLMFLNLAQSIGAGLLLNSIVEGICVVDVTSLLYFSFFIPLLYHTFLREFFGVSQAAISFSYNDELVEEDSVSLPHQQSFSSLKTESDFIYQPTGTANTTQFNSITTPNNPLYIASLQSPDSIAGYSMNSQILDLPTSIHLR